MSYTRERDQFIARMTTEGLDLAAVLVLLRQATAMQRYAELACSSEAADRDRIPCPASTTIVRQYGSATRPPMRTIISRRKPTGPCLCDQSVSPNGTEPCEACGQYPCLESCGALDYGEHQDIPRITLQDHRAEQRAQQAVPAGWRVLSQGDPRGYVLRVIPPSWAARNEGQDRHNIDSIGVPARPSRLVF